MECVNCGKTNHTFRECHSPIMSFGVCAVKFVERVPYYLLIRRRDSLAYVEFMRGRYKLNMPDYIQLLINNMTNEEHDRLLTSSFNDLWNKVWNGQNTRQYRNEYETAHIAFDRLKHTGDINGKIMSSYIESSTKTWEEPEWGFPKGRRTLHESELACALREFSEETGFPNRTVHLIPNIDPFIEEYTGTNSVKYKQTYFVGLCESDILAVHQPHNRIMSREVGNIGWFTFEDAYKKIRDTNVEKRSLLERLHNFMLTQCANDD